MIYDLVYGSTLRQTTCDNMICNEFSSKIDLPALCADNKITGYEFRHIPPFGWFAFNPDRSVIVNLFDIMGNDCLDAYKLYTVKKPQYQSFKMHYSEVCENRLRNNILNVKSWNAAWKVAQQEALYGKVMLASKYYKLKEILEQQGQLGLLNTKLGLITEKVLKEFPQLDWPENSKFKLLVPTFCTPKHMCSLELACVTDVAKRDIIFINGVKGWYGNVDKQIVSDLSELATKPGCTWDIKVDAWSTKLMDLSPTLNTKDCLKIFTEAKSTKFITSPLTVITQNNKLGEIKNHIKDLNYAQIEELQKVVGEDLLPLWKRQQEEETVIGNLKFIKKHNRYYVEKFGVTQELTNFTIDIHKIVKEGKEFKRVGHIYYQDMAIPFSMADSCFTRPSTFLRRLREIFLESGAGVPIILTNYQGYMLDIINRFNQFAKVENEV